MSKSADISRRTVIVFAALCLPLAACSPKFTKKKGQDEVAVGGAKCGKNWLNSPGPRGRNHGVAIPTIGGKKNKS